MNAKSTTFKKSGGRCAVSAVVSAPSFRLQGRGRSPSGPKIQAQRAVKQKSLAELGEGLNSMAAILNKHGAGRRNPLIADLLRRIHLIEAWGRGIPLILEKAPASPVLRNSRRLHHRIPAPLGCPRL
jgi:hypothetical protein